MTPKTVAIVIAKPGLFRESIHILLTSISQISEVLPTENLTEALKLATARTPSIVILDARAADHDLPYELELIGGTWHGASRIVLTEDKNEVQQAANHGADLILLKGFNASKFINEIEEILNKHKPNVVSQ